MLAILAPPVDRRSTAAPPPEAEASVSNRDGFLNSLKMNDAFKDSETSQVPAVQKPFKGKM